MTLTRSVFALAIVAVLAGCSTLPRDGPSGKAVERGASTPTAAGDYAILDLDYGLSERIKALPPRFMGSLVAASADPAQSEGVIGAGDTLSIAIFEPTGSLFSTTSGSASAAGGVRSGNQSLPPVTVDRSGSVTIPFAGPVQVSGLTASRAAEAIRRALLGKAANPQVVVSIAGNAFNTVTILGEIREPGKAPLSSNADGILDVIASRGGSPRAPEDVMVNIQRGSETFSAPLTAVTTEFNQNVRLARGDQINLVYRPRRFSTFGALGAISQQDMGPGSLNLAGAISRVGGLDTNTANARSVLVFRFERPEVAQALGLTQAPTARGVPVVYRLNLEEGVGFFVANNFEIQPDDIVFVPRSGSAELSKFFTLVQTFTRVIYDVSVTSTLNNN